MKNEEAVESTSWYSTEKIRQDYSRGKMEKIRSGVTEEMPGVTHMVME